MGKRATPSATKRLIDPLTEEETAFHAALRDGTLPGGAKPSPDFFAAHRDKQARGFETLARYEELRDLALAELPLEERLSLLLNGTRMLLASDVASVLLLDPETDELWPRASVGFTTPLGAKPLVVNGSMKKVLKNDEALLVDVVEPRDHFRADLAEEGVSSLIAAPIPVNGTAQGVLICGQKTESFYDGRDLELLVIVADRMGLGLTRSHSMEALVAKNGRESQSSKFKTQLLHMATHDLKTPLSALTTQLQMMAKFEQTPEARKQSIGVMQRSVSRLTAMLDDFLDLARVDAGRLTIKPAPTNVARVLRDTAEVFESKAQERSITLNVDEASERLQVAADERRLAQVTANLVSNAIRYSPRGSTITLGTRPADDSVEIYVQDEGMGLTQEQLTRLFKPFSQVQGVAEESQGTGLGLYLSQAIVQAHGGRLRLESAGKGKGTRASFTLPRVPMRAAR